MFRFKKNINRYSETPDQDLVQLFKETGDQELIGILFTRYTHLVYGLSLKILRNPEEAEDIVMEIFESLFEKLLHHEIDNFKNWLYSVTRNACLMFLRKKKTFFNNHKKIFENLYEENVENEPDFNLIYEENNSEIKNLNKALDKLNKEQQSCIKLMYIENKSYKEICVETGFSLKQVKSYIQNGKRNLKNIMSG